MSFTVKQTIQKALLSLLAILTIVSCTQQSTPKDCSNYDEAELTVEVTTNWAEVPSGIQASIGSIDERYMQHEVPEVSASTKWNATAWKGERMSAQVILWSKDSVQTVELKLSDFKTKDGAIIAANNTQTRFVRYVLTDEFAEGCGNRKPQDYAVSLSADVLDNIECMNIKAETARPVWITIDVPSDAVAGSYTSTLELLANGKKKHSFTLTLNVIDQILPPARDWAFHLDLWQNPYAVARTEGVEPWSEAHWKALKPSMQLLANAGQKVITTTLNKRPWNGQTEDAFDSMIEWKKKKDGTWVYEYTIFDNWVEFMMDLGITKQISCYSMVPWGNILFYKDEATNEEVKVSAAPGSKEYEELWKPFLTDFIVHLKSKGWENKTLIAMDERSPEEMKAMLKILNEVAPSLGVSLADNHKSYKLYPDQLVDLCVAHGATVDAEDRAYRANKNYVTSWYVCCADVFPNVFTFSPPAEGAFIGWYTMAAGFDGFLRWAYNSFTKDALVDSRFRTWPAGDTYVVYPQGRSSIRFERLMEGIQDAEKIRIVRNKFEQDKTPAGKVKLAEMNQVLEKFNVIEKPSNMIEMLQRGKEFLNNPEHLNN
ncbi:MAG: glycoside hydrolase domain-containing protein [Candidatus Saccharimonadaceae bacterium]